MTAELEVRREGALVRLQLSRPRVGNSLSASLVAQLEEALRRCEQDGVRALVIEGEGPHFCTGFDLSNLAEETDDSLLARFVRIELMLQRVHRAPFPTVAIARGRVFGAGADLFAACEQRWVAAPSQFTFPGAAFGLVLGTARLARRVGMENARDWVRSGAVITDDEALQAGLATRRIDDGEIEASIDTLLTGARRLDATTVAAVHAASLGARAAEDAADLSALVQSAARLGLRDRIEAYRAASRVKRQ